MTFHQRLGNLRKHITSKTNFIDGQKLKGISPLFHHNLHVLRVVFGVFEA